MAISTNKGGLDLSGFDKAVKSEKKIDLSGFDEAVSKKKGQGVQQQPTGGVSPSGSVPTQPGNGLSVSQSGDVKSDNPKVNVKFNTSNINVPEQGFFESIGTAISDWWNETDTNLQPQDTDFIVTELANQAKLTSGYEKNFFKGYNVNTDYSKKYLTEKLKKVSYKDGTPLSEYDIEAVSKRFNEYLGNQKAMKPVSVDDISRKLYKSQLKQSNPKLYEATYPNESKAIPYQEKEEKKKQLKWEESSKFGKYFSKDVLDDLSESQKNTVGQYLLDNAGEVQKMERFSLDGVPKNLQNDIIQKALAKKAGESAARLQIYRDQGDLKKLEDAVSVNKNIKELEAKAKVLAKQLDAFDIQDLSPEQKKAFDELKAAYQVASTEYSDDKKVFESLDKEISPIMTKLGELNTSIQKDEEFTKLQAKLTPVFEQLKAMLPLAEQGNQDAINSYNQLYSYYKKDIDLYNQKAINQEALVNEYNKLYNANKEQIDAYDQRAKNLEALRLINNNKANELNKFVSGIKQTSKLEQYKMALDKYNSIADELVPLYAKSKELGSTLNEDVVTGIFQSIEPLTEYESFQNKLIKEREPSFRQMSNVAMDAQPYNAGLAVAQNAVLPVLSMTTEFLTQKLGGFAKASADIIETATGAGKDYYSFADYVGDLVQYGFDGSGKYWTNEIIPGLRKSEFTDPITGDYIYTPQSLVVGAFEQMGQIAGAAIGTYATLGLGASMNTAIVAPMFFATYDNNKDLAKQLGFQGASATTAAILFSQIEGISELIFPDIQFFEGAMKREAMKMFLENFQKGGTKMAVKRFLETVGKEVSEEYAVELGKYISTALTSTVGPNKIYRIDPSQLMETTVFTILASGAPASIQSAVYSSKTFNKAMKFEMAKDLENSVAMINEYNKYGKLDNAKAKRLIRDLSVISAIQGQLPNDISIPKRVVISSIYAKRAELEEKLNDPNITEEIKDSYKKALKELSDQIALTMLADDEGFTKAYNEALKNESEKINSEVEKEYPGLGTAPTEKIELSELDQLRMQILDDIFKDSSAQNKADALEQRMNNAEEISMTEINDVLDGLYKQVEMVMDNYFDNEAGKQYVQALLDKIDKIKSYEFATNKEVAFVTERKAVQTARNTVQEAASVINLARAPRRKATITSEDGTTGTYSIEVGPDGTVTFEQPNAEPIRVGNVNDVNKSAKIVETVLNEKGLPQSVSFSITDEQGKSHTIKVEAKGNLKPQQLLDLAINIRANELGTVDPTDFDEAYEEVTREVEVGKTYPNMPVLGEMSDEEYFDFLDNGNVSNERIMDIARKVMTNQQLTPQENEIFTDKTAEINQVIKTYKPYRNAVQEQTAGQVPVQPEAVRGKTDQKGQPQAKPQEAAQEGQVQVKPRQKTQTPEQIREQAKRLLLDKATANVLASFKKFGIDIRIIENEAEYDAIVGMGGTNGLFDDQNGVVYVNPARMKLAQQGFRVLFHESTHPVLNILYNTDRPTYDRIMKGMMDAAKKGLPMWQDLQNFRQRYIDRGYSEEQADNELMTETIGRIINGEIGLNDIPVGWRQAVVDMLNKIAKLLRLKPIGAVTDAGKFRDFAASLKDAFEKGRDISTIVGAENVKKFQSPFVDINGEQISEEKLQFSLMNDFSNITTGMTFEYLSNNSEFDKIKTDGFITENMVLDDFTDAYVVLHSPDAAFSGTIKKNGNVLVDGKGGIFYPIRFHKDGFMWASTKGGATTLANVLNESAKLNNGRVLMALVSAPRTKLLSSTTMSNAIVDFFTSKIVDNKINIKQSYIINALKKSAKSTIVNNKGEKIGLNISLSGITDLNEVVSKIKTKLSPDNSTFADRKQFVFALLDDISSRIKGTESEQLLGRFLSEEMSFEEYKQQGKKVYNLSRSNLAEALSNMLQEPMLRNEKDSGNIYAIIEIDATKGYKSGSNVVKVIDSKKHESYPKTIVPIDKKNKVRLHILQDRLQWNQVSEDPTTNEIIKSDRELKVFPTSGVSVSPVRIKGQPSLVGERDVAKAIEATKGELGQNKIEGKLFNEQESQEYQNLIESKYSNNLTVVDSRYDDLRQSMYNYENPIAEKDVNGVNLRITQGLIEVEPKTNKRRETYLLYADGKVAGKFYSVEDIKKTISFIESNLVRTLPTSGQPSLVEGQEFESTINGETVVLKPVDVDVVNGFYSPLEQEVFGSRQDRMPAKKWLDRFKGREEAKWTGLNDWLESQEGVVSKQDILDYMKENRVLISEVVLGGKIITLSKMKWEYVTEDSDLYGDYDYISSDGKYRVQEQMGRLFLYERGLEGEDYYIDRINSINEDIKVNLSDKIKYFKYQLEGEKENYREVLVTLPSKLSQDYKIVKGKDGKYRIKNPDGSINEGRYWSVRVAAESALAGDIKKAKTTFQSSHFDEPNILVHLRMNERTDAEGNKVLFLEEVQSDWAQKGRREGFDLDKKQVEEKYNQAQSALSQIENKIENKYGKDWDLRGDIDEVLSKEDYENYRKAAGERAKWGNLLEKEYKTGIPTAPFVMNTSDWVKLAMRVALKEAVKSDANSIAWTTGEQQNDRFDLSGKVNYISSDAVRFRGDIAHNVNLSLQDGKLIKLTVINRKIDSAYGQFGGESYAQSYKGKNLEDVIGKELAEKVLSVKLNEPKQFQGQDLKVGGKGMIGFYGTVTKPGIVGQVASKLFGQEVGAVEVNGVEQPSVTVTPQMKAEVKRGLPQFSLMEEGEVTKRLEGVDITVLENIEKPISESKFENKYVAQHKDLVGKREGNWDKNKENILKSGFRGGFNVNALPIYTGYEGNVIDQRYGNRKGDIIYILPKEGVIDGPNGYKTKEGYKPKLSDVFVIEYDKQPTYEAYRNNLKNPSYIASAYIQAKQDGSNPELVKAVEDAIGKPRGQASLMDDPAPIIEQFGRKAESFADAEQALSNGDYVFLSSETDGIPYLANDIQSLKANYDEVIVVKKEDYPIPSAPKEQADDITKKANRAYPRGQASLVSNSLFLDVNATAARQYPLYQSMLQMGLDAYDNGARDIEMFKAYGNSIAWPDKLSRDYHTTMVWNDVMRIKRNKKPFIKSQSDYAKMLRKITKKEKYLNDLLNEKKSKTWKSQIAKGFFDSKRDFFNALASQTGEIWNVVAAYVHTLGGMTAKSLYQAELYMEGTFNGLSETENITINREEYSERQIFERMLEYFGYLETVRKMEDKFDEFIQLETKVREVNAANKDIQRIVKEINSLQDKYILLQNSNSQKAQDILNKINDLNNDLSAIKTRILNKYGNVPLDNDGNYDVSDESDLRDQVKDYLDINLVLGGKGTTAEPYYLKDFKRANLTPAQAQFGLDSILLTDPKLYDKLSKRADAYFEAYKLLLKQRLDNKMISREAYDEMVKYNYVPTRFIGYLLSEVSEDQGINLNTNLEAKIQRLRGGSEEETVMQYAEMLKFATFAVNRSIQRNKATLKLAEAVDLNPENTAFYKPMVTKRDRFGNAIEWEYDDKTKGLIKYFVDGKVEAIATEKAVADAYNGIKTAATVMPEWTGLLFMTTPFRMVTTNLNPGFGLAQIVIDLNQALLTNDAYSTILYGAPAILFRDLKLLSGKALGLAARKMGLNFNLDKEWEELYTEAREYGALISFTRSESLENSIAKSAGKQGLWDRLSNGNNPFAWTKDKIERLNSSMEYVTRLAIYRKQRNNLEARYIKDNNGRKPTGAKLDDIRTQAAAASLNMLNYNRGGTVTKGLNDVMAYLNVGFQVPYSVYEYAKKNPLMFTIKASELAVYGALAATMLYKMLSDDDKKKYLRYYKRLSKFEKSNYWHFPNPNRDPNDPDTWLIRYKKPTMLLPLVNAVETYSMNWVTDGKTQTADDYIMGLPSTESPSLASDMATAQPFNANIVSAIPTLNASLIYFYNYDTYRRQQVVPKEETIADVREGLEDPQVGKFYKYVSQLGVESPYLAEDGLFSPKRMDRAVKAMVGDMSRNLVTSYTLWGLGSLMNAFSGDYRKLDKYLSSEPEKTFVSKLIEGAGFTQRFTTKIPDMMPETREKITKQQMEKNAIYDSIRWDINDLIQRKTTINKETLRQWYKDNKDIREGLFDVKDYETLLENAVKLSNRNSEIKEIEKDHLWLKRFILAPSSMEKLTIWKSESADYTNEEKKKLLKFLVKNKLHILNADEQFDSELANTIK